MSRTHTVQQGYHLSETFNKHSGGNNKEVPSVASRWQESSTQSCDGPSRVLTWLVQPQPNLDLSTSTTCPATLHASNPTPHCEVGAQTSHHPPACAQMEAGGLRAPFVSSGQPHTQPCLPSLPMPTWWGSCCRLSFGSRSPNF